MDGTHAHNLEINSAGSHSHSFTTTSIMSDHALELDFPSVRQQSRALLEKNQLFFQRPEYCAESCRYQEQIAHQFNLVDRLELRMTIVAPMKAGKSTIINALIGQELLPSHSAAMTTLPTEILFAPQRNEPVLHLGASLRAACRETARRIREQIDRQGLDQALAQAGQHPHLHNLIQSLHEDFRIEEEIAGRKRAVAMLTALNHLVRLAAVLTEQPADLSQSEIPVLETPFRHSSGIAEAALGLRWQEKLHSRRRNTCGSCPAFPPSLIRPCAN